jgi:hypothetical protein
VLLSIISVRWQTGKTRRIGAGSDAVQFPTLVTYLFLLSTSTYQYQPPMALSDFANADINGIVDELSVEEAVKLIAGVGLWHTATIERLGIPAIKVRLLS